jgi:hypothetical protein
MQGPTLGPIAALLLALQRSLSTAAAVWLPKAPPCAPLAGALTRTARRAGDPGRLAAPVQPRGGQPAAGGRHGRRRPGPGRHARARGLLRRLLARLAHRAAVLEGAPARAALAQHHCKGYSPASPAVRLFWQARPRARAAPARSPRRLLARLAHRAPVLAGAPAPYGTRCAH